MLHLLYRGLTGMAGPAVRLYLDHRSRRGKEDAARRGERLGVADRPRPPGPLVWLHGASVGEANSALILINRLLEAAPGAHVLLTTGTVTSAALMADRLPPRAFHQFAPVDLPDAVQRFIDHWRPDAALWLESELWPNQLAALRERNIPAALVNARLSARSFRRWKRLPGAARTMLSTFAHILAQSDDDAARLTALGAPDVACVGNLKFSARPPAADPAALAALRETLGRRPLWLFASTHAGEEELAAEVHRRLAARLPDVLTVIAPRHAVRGAEIARTLTDRGLKVARRALNDPLEADCDVYLADTMGELGLFCRLAPVVCMGGSFVPHGGQNPVEPAQSGAATLYGPHMFNFTQITRLLEAAGGALPLPDGDALAPALLNLLTDEDARRKLTDGAAEVTQANRRIVDDALESLRPLLTAAGVVPPPSAAAS
jgi:3-deoxy-D-manno-octulosonic-acid transferase